MSKKTKSKKTKPVSKKSSKTPTKNTAKQTAPAKTVKVVKDNSKRPLIIALSVILGLSALAGIGVGGYFLGKNNTTTGGGGGGGGGGEPQEGDPVVTNFDFGKHEGLDITADNAVVGQDYDGTIHLNETATPVNASQYILPEELDKVTYKKGGTETEITDYTYTLNKEDDSNSAHLQIDKKYVLGPINIKLTLDTVTPVEVTIGHYDINVVELKNGGQTLKPGESVVVKNKSLSLEASIKATPKPGFGYRLDHDSFRFVDKSHKPMKGVTWDYTFNTSTLIINNLKENCTLNVTPTNTVTITPGAIDEDKYRMEYKGQPFDGAITVDSGADVSFDCYADSQYTLSPSSFVLDPQSVSYNFTPGTRMEEGFIGTFTLLAVKTPVTVGINNTEIVKIAITTEHCSFEEESVNVTTQPVTLHPTDIDEGYELTNDCFVFDDPNVVHTYDRENNILTAFNFTKDCNLTVIAKEESIRFDAYAGGKTENCTIYSNQQALGENPVEVELPKSATECTFTTEVTDGFVLTKDKIQISYTEIGGGTQSIEEFGFENDTITISNTIAGLFEKIDTLTITAKAVEEPEYVMATILPNNCTVYYNGQAYTDAAMIKVYPQTDTEESLYDYITFDVKNINSELEFDYRNVVLDPKSGAYCGSSDIEEIDDGYRVTIEDVEKNFSVNIFAVDTYVVLDEESLQYGTFENGLPYYDLENDIGDGVFYAEFVPNPGFEGKKFKFKTTGDIQLLQSSMWDTRITIYTEHIIGKGQHSELHLIPQTSTPILKLLNSSETTDIIELCTDEGTKQDIIYLDDYVGGNQAYFYFKFKNSEYADNYKLVIDSPTREGDVTIAEYSGDIYEGTITFQDSVWDGYSLILRADPIIKSNITITQVAEGVYLSYWDPEVGDYIEIEGPFPKTIQRPVDDDGDIELSIDTEMGMGIMVTEDDIEISGDFESFELLYGWQLIIHNVTGDIEIESISARSSLVSIPTKLATDYKSTYGISIYGGSDMENELSTTSQNIDYDQNYGNITFVVETSTSSIESSVILQYLDGDNVEHTIYGRYEINAELGGGAINFNTMPHPDIYDAKSIVLSLRPHAQESSFVGNPATINCNSGNISFDGYNLGGKRNGPANVYRSTIQVYIAYTGRVGQTPEVTVEINETVITAYTLSPIEEGNFNYLLVIPNIEPSNTIVVSVSGGRG